MGFKIGDRVRIVSGEDIRGEGEVGRISSILAGDYDWRIDLADGDWVPVYDQEIRPADEPVIRRGPKPLTLTGGKVRITVRNGWTTRKDKGNWMHGRRLYESGWYR